MWGRCIVGKDPSRWPDKLHPHIIRSFVESGNSTGDILTDPYLLFGVGRRLVTWLRLIFSDDRRVWPSGGTAIVCKRRIPPITRMRMLMISGRGPFAPTIRPQGCTHLSTRLLTTSPIDTIRGQRPIMDPFVYNPNPGRVVFGSGTVQKLPEEIARLNLSAPLLLSTPQQISQAELLKDVLQGKIAGIFTEATMHTPTHITEKALEFAKQQQADSVVSIGGGSTVGLGKAISVRTGLPHICIPTTYAGSEMTNILGETADGVKKTRTDPKIFPGIVIYDVDLTMTLPPSMSATSGVNAIAHAGKPCDHTVLGSRWKMNLILQNHSGSSICSYGQSNHQPFGHRRNPGSSKRASRNCRGSLVAISAVSGSVRSVALRNLPWQRRYVAAS